MTKVQKIAINIVIIIIGYITPILIIRAGTGDFRKIYTVQFIGFLAILVTGGIISYLNERNRKLYTENKILFIIFEILGALGVLYALSVLYLIFAFRNGISF